MLFDDLQPRETLYARVSTRSYSYPCLIKSNNGFGKEKFTVNVYNFGFGLFELSSHFNDCRVGSILEPYYTFEEQHPVSFSMVKCAAGWFLK